MEAKSKTHTDSSQQTTLPFIPSEVAISEPPEAVLTKLETSIEGLSSEEADNRLSIYGENSFVKSQQQLPVVQFLSHFKNPLVLILIFAASVSLFTNDYATFSIIITIILLSTVLDFYQEYTAEKAAAELRKKVAVTTSVIRDNKKQEMLPTQLVPGDIVVLSGGDIVPADSRVLIAKDFFVEQSSLTGESFPVEKTNQAIASFELANITGWENYVFVGSSVISGTATTAVVRTGLATEFGKIAKRIVQAKPETDFERGLRHFGTLIMQVTFVLVLFVFFVNTFTGKSALESFTFSIALAVGLTPELLPMIMTINLSKGAIAMSKKGVIVKHLPSIQNFGSMDILCTDKTGTLTENRIGLISHTDVNGNESDRVLLYGYLNAFYQSGLKNPMDEAIIQYRTQDTSMFVKIDEIPFDFIRKRLSVIVMSQSEKLFISKGAPELLLEICNTYDSNGHIENLDEDMEDQLLDTFRKLSSDGFRVLGLVYKDLAGCDTCNFEAIDESDMTFLGFLTFQDPPKETTKEALIRLKDAGIELKILTGDNELVTKKLCQEVGLEIKGIVTGADITNSVHLNALVERNNVFARLTPVQKNEIISALRKNGHIVGFMGDGVNDAPSMREADVSISVENAVDVAKATADIILLRNDLNVLQEGVKAGRMTFSNTMKYTLMAISSNFGNMFSMAGSSIFLGFLPMQATQILLNNLLYDFSNFSIPSDTVDVEYIEKPKRLPGSALRDYMIWIGPISSIFDFATFAALIFVFHVGVRTTDPNLIGLFQTSWFLESLLTQTFVMFVIRIRRYPFWLSRPSNGVLFACFGVVAIGFIIPLTPLGATFGFVVPPPLLYIIIFTYLLIYIFLVDIIKREFYKRHWF